MLFIIIFRKRVNNLTKHHNSSSKLSQQKVNQQRSKLIYSNVALSALNHSKKDHFHAARYLLIISTATAVSRLAI
jgi:hypothetical protein